MRKHSEPEVPALPEEARFAMAAFRAEHPPAHLQARVHAALRAAEEGRVAVRRERSWQRVSKGLKWGLGMAVAGAATAVVLLAGDENLGIPLHALPSREIQVQLPEEGSGWVHLPWTLDSHPEGLAVVKLEAPAELDVHREGLPYASPWHSSCGAERCVHHFVAPAGEDVQPLRVRIDEPGRYELRLSHTSDERHVHEHYVVVAER
jgi:hypothetical protein